MKRPEKAIQFLEEKVRWYSNIIEYHLTCAKHPLSEDELNYNLSKIKEYEEIKKDFEFCLAIVKKEPLWKLVLKSIFG